MLGLIAICETEIEFPFVPHFWFLNGLRSTIWYVRTVLLFRENLIRVLKAASCLIMSVFWPGFHKQLLQSERCSHIKKFVSICSFSNYCQKFISLQIESAWCVSFLFELSDGETSSLWTDSMLVPISGLSASAAGMPDFGPPLTCLYMPIFLRNIAGMDNFLSWSHKFILTLAEISQNETTSCRRPAGIVTFSKPALVKSQLESLGCTQSLPPKGVALLWCHNSILVTTAMLSKRTGSNKSFRPLNTSSICCIPGSLARTWWSPVSCKQSTEQAVRIIKQRGGGLTNATGRMYGSIQQCFLDVILVFSSLQPVLPAIRF